MSDDVMHSAIGALRDMGDRDCDIGIDDGAATRLRIRRSLEDRGRALRFDRLGDET